MKSCIIEQAKVELIRTCKWILFKNFQNAVSDFKEDQTDNTVLLFGGIFN